MNATTLNHIDYHRKRMDKCDERKELPGKFAQHAGLLWQEQPVPNRALILLNYHYNSPQKNEKVNPQGTTEVTLKSSYFCRLKKKQRMRKQKPSALVRLSCSGIRYLCSFFPQ
jgi:hypothetical protein